MNFTSLDVAVVVVYLVAMLGLGLYQARKVKNTGDYFAGGRGFNKFLMMMHALGTGTHADDPVGVVGASYKHGLAGIWYTFVYLFVTPFYWLMAPLFRRARFFTTADFFEARFGKGLGLLYAVMGILTFAVNMGTLLKGTGLIATAVTQGQIPEWLAMSMMTVVFLIYGCMGGLIATVVTESVQGLLIIVMSMLLIPFGLAKVGGMAGLHQLVDGSKFNLAAPAVMQEVTIPWIIAGTLMSLIGIVSQPHTMEVCSTGKTEWEGRIGFTYGNFIKRFCAIAWALSGIVVIGMVANGTLAPLGDKREEAFGTAIRALLPTGCTGLMFAAILAAQMSTLSAFMVAGSALLSRNIYQRYIAPGASDKQILGIARYAGLLIVFLGLVFAFAVDSVADALMFFWGLSTLTGVFMWAGVLWRRTNSLGAWISFGVMAIIWMAKGPVGMTLHDAYYPPVQVHIQDTKQASADVLVLAKKAKLPGGQTYQKVDFPRNSLAFESDWKPIAGSVVTADSADLIATRERAKGRAVFVARDDAKPYDAVYLEASPGTGKYIKHQKHPFWLGQFGAKSDLFWLMICYLPLGILALIVGSFLGKPLPKSVLDKFYLLISTPVGQEDKLIEAGVDVVYAGASESHPWEINHPKLVNIGGFIVAALFSFFVLAVLWWVSKIGA